MLEPTVTQVGHYLPLRCGHNGNLRKEERKLLMKHLEKAGFLLSERYMTD